MLLDFSERMTSKQLSHVLVVQFVKNHKIWTFKVNFLEDFVSQNESLSLIIVSMKSIHLKPYL